MLKSYKVFDLQSDKHPHEVGEEIREMWANYELGNDHSYIRWYEDMVDEYPHTAKFLQEQGVEDDNVLLHWWR